MLSWNVIHRSYPVTWWKWAFRQLRYLLFWGVDFSNLSSSLYFIHLLFLPWSSLSPLITSCKRRIPHSRSTHSKSTHTVQIQDRRSVKMRESEEGEGTVPWIAVPSCGLPLTADKFMVFIVFFPFSDTLTCFKLVWSCECSLTSHHRPAGLVAQQHASKHA